MNGGRILTGQVAMQLLCPLTTAETKKEGLLSHRSRTDLQHFWFKSSRKPFPGSMPLWSETCGRHRDMKHPCPEPPKTISASCTRRPDPSWQAEVPRCSGPVSKYLGDSGVRGLLCPAQGTNPSRESGLPTYCSFPP